MANTCATCGHANADDDRFCGSCGSPLSAEAFDLLEHTGSITSIISAGPATGSGGMSPVGSGTQFELPTGTALLVVHNHPSGDPTPSADDARLTVRLAQAADVLDIPLLDHLIVGEDGRYFSFRESGLVTGTRFDGSRA